MCAAELSTDDLLAIDEICDRFEAAWQGDVPPKIADFLTFDGPARAHLVTELVQIDKACRARKGTRVDLEIYVADIPEHADDIRRIAFKDDNSSNLFVRAWRIEIISGPHRGTIRILPGTGAITVGRSSSVELSLPDDLRCSREHATIEYSPSQCKLTDLGSKNGIYVNGAKTSTSFLRPGDGVVIGESRFRIDADNS